MLDYLDILTITPIENNNFHSVNKKHFSNLQSFKRYGLRKEEHCFFTHCTADGNFQNIPTFSNSQLMRHVGQYQGSSMMVWGTSGVLICILFFYILWELCLPTTATSSLSSLQLSNQKLNIPFFLALSFTYPKKIHLLGG
jgi:hypothetical protein